MSDEAGGGADELRVWVAVRVDLGMSVGKMVAQAGHAVEWLAVDRLDAGDPAFRAYLAGSSPKSTVAARNEHALRRIAAEALAAGIPHVLVTDEGRTELAGRNATAVAFGPARRATLPSYLSGLRLLALVAAPPPRVAA